ncbi:hypothetical protein B0H13DRAFT_2653276 [Mycena leptocephala]|nr:hypothetical protein B0H13DRAFT_2653276 [Mycena leptocephala]
MNSGDEIPTEIWDEIVEHFSAGGNCETLQRLNLVNRRFHHLAHQRLFTYFTFHPYSVAVDSYGMSAEDLILPLDPTPEHLRQRLEFWASEDIAPCVRECTVRPLEFEQSTRESPPGEDPYTLLKAFYEFLPRFINLEVFNAFTLHFTTIAMTNLRLLPKLTAMNIDMCPVAKGEILDLNPPSKLKLESFRFSNCANRLQRWWSCALCPDTLRSLCLDFSGSHDQLFFYEESQLPCFPNVQFLELILGRRVAAHYLVPFAKFPGVKDLALPKWHDGPSDLHKIGDTKFCPLLERYYGPRAVLSFFPVSTLTNLSVSTCEPEDFFAEMGSVDPKPTRISYLKVSFAGYLSSLRDLSDLFSESKELKILHVVIARRSWSSRLDRPDDTAQMALSFFETLPSSLPQQIVKLAIDWKFDDPIDLLDMKKLKDDIRAQRPTLKTLWIHCRHYAFVWAEMPDGKQSMAHGGPDFAANILRSFETGFYGF